MGLVARGGNNEETTLGGTSQQLFMDPCADCGAPVTVVAATRPEVLRCTACAAAAAAAPSEVAPPDPDCSDSDVL